MTNNINNVNNISTPANGSDSMNSGSIDSIDQSTVSSEQLKEQLYTIMTSDEYSKKIEITLPKHNEEPSSSWLEELLKFLFDNRLDVNAIDLLSLIVKGVFIFALLLFIWWVVRNADSMQGWLQKHSWKLSKRTTQIDDYRQSHLAQGWEKLPPHHQLPQIVSQLLDEGKLLPASSILYRGSLRWLANNRGLHIHPANTELQCVQLIQKIRQKNENSQLDQVTSEYIINIIEQWIPIAYDVSIQSSTLNDSNALHILHKIVTNWHRHLPIESNAKHSVDRITTHNTPSKPEGVNTL